MLDELVDFNTKDQIGIIINPDFTVHSVNPMFSKNFSTKIMEIMSKLINYELDVNDIKIINSLNIDQLIISGKLEIE